MGMLSCFRCGNEIVFDSKKRSKYGRYIPLDPKTNDAHNCPKLISDEKKINSKIN